MVHLGAWHPEADRQQAQGKTLLKLLEDLHEDQAAHLLHICMVPRASSCAPIAGWFSPCQTPRI